MKIHTKRKRRMRLGTHKKGIKSRPDNKKPFKKFKNEESAKKWIEGKSSKEHEIKACKSGVKVFLK
ncbi:MAG: hypothetical protein PHG05_01490 [Candidatus Nanoarchaeia archaeon]|nr:hypothetical protein [Candidatus Nanoarchaeia archaeon]